MLQIYQQGTNASKSYLCHNVLRLVVTCLPACVHSFPTVGQFRTTGNLKSKPRWSYISEFLLLPFPDIKYIFERETNQALDQSFPFASNLRGTELLKLYFDSNSLDFTWRLYLVARSEVLFSRFDSRARSWTFQSQLKYYGIVWYITVFIRLLYGELTQSWTSTSLNLLARSLFVSFRFDSRARSWTFQSQF